MYKTIYIIVLLIIFCSIVFSKQFYSFPADHFDVLYTTGVREMAVQLVQEGDAIYRELTDFYETEPEKRLKVYLLDNADFANAYGDVFSNAIFIYVNRSSADYFDNSYKWWVPFVFSHELTHIIISNKSDWTRKFTGRLGYPVSVFFDSAFTPSHLHEGVSIYSESLLNDAGRYDDPMFLSYISADFHERRFFGLSLAGGPQTPLFSPAGMNYLYGAWFIKYLEEIHGPQAVKQIVRDYGSVYRYNFTSAVEQITSMRFSEVIDDWRQWLEEKTALPEKVTIGVNVTDGGYYSGVTGVSDKSLYTFVQKDGGRTKLERRTAQSIESKIFPVPTAFSVSPSGRLAMIYPNSSGLEEYNLHLYTGTYEEGVSVISGVDRPNNCAWINDDELLYTYLENGGTGLALLNLETKETDVILRGSPDFFINDISVSQDHQTFMSITFNESADLYSYDLRSDSFECLTSTDGNEIDPFVMDSKIYFSTNKNGIYDIYSLETWEATVTRLTRTRYGAYNPVVFNGKLYYRGYAGKGYDLYEMALDQTLSNTSAATETSVNSTETSLEETSEAYKPFEIEQDYFTLEEDPIISAVIEEWDYKAHTPALPRFGVPFLIPYEKELYGVAALAGWDDMKEWIWYGYIASWDENRFWDYTLMHRGLPDTTISWNGTEEREEILMEIKTPFQLRETSKFVYIEPKVELGVYHTARSLEFKPQFDVSLYEGFNYISYPDNTMSVPEFFMNIKLGTSGYYSSSGIGMGLPLSTLGMARVSAFNGELVFKTEIWYPLNFIKPIGTPDGKFRLNSVNLHLGALTSTVSETPVTGIAGLIVDFGVQYWLDLRLQLDLEISDKIVPNISVGNSTLSSL